MLEAQKSHLLSNTLLNSFKLLVSFIFPVYCVVIDVNVSYCLDDHWFMETIKENGGAFAAAKYFYLNYEGAFLLFLRSFTFLYLPKSLFLIVTLIVHLLSAWFFVLSLFVFLKSKISYLDSWLIASALCAVQYFLSLDVSCNYHWLTGSAYLVCVTATFWATGFLLRNKPWFALPFLIFLMQSRINFAALIFAAYGMLFLYQLLIQRKFNRAYFYSLILMFLALLIYVIAPGNWNRSVTSDESTEGLIVSLQRLFIDEYILHLPHALVFSLLIALIVPDDFVEKIRLRKLKFFIPILLLVLFSLMNFAILYFATTKYYYGNRVWAVNTAFYFIVVSYYSVLSVAFMKNIVGKKFNNVRSLSSLGIVFLLVINGYIFVNLGRINLPLAINYSKAFDHFVSKTQKMPLTKSDTLWVPFLPESGVLRYHNMRPHPVKLPKGYPMYEIEKNYHDFGAYYNIKPKVFMTKDSVLLKRWNETN